MFRSQDFVYLTLVQHVLGAMNCLGSLCLSSPQQLCKTVLLLLLLFTYAEFRCRMVQWLAQGLEMGSVWAGLWPMQSGSRVLAPNHHVMLSKHWETHGFPVCKNTWNTWLVWGGLSWQNIYNNCTWLFHSANTYWTPVLNKQPATPQNCHSDGRDGQWTSGYQACEELIKVLM